MFLFTFLTFNIIGIGIDSAPISWDGMILTPLSVDNMPGKTSAPDGSNRRIPALSHDKKRKIRRKYFPLKKFFVPLP